MVKPLFSFISPGDLKENDVYNIIDKILKNPSEYTEINRIFAEKAMLLSESRVRIKNKNLYGLSKYISNNYAIFRDFICELRTQLIHKKEFEIKLDDCNDVKLFMILSLLNDFKLLGMIGEFDFNNESFTVNGKFIKNKVFPLYINGEFFEDFAYCEAKTVLDELSREYGVDYELYRNVYVHIPIGNKVVQTREVDLLIRFGDKVYLAEVKSGCRYKIRNFYTIGMRLGIEPFSSIVLVSRLSEQNNSINENKYRLYVADSFCFAKKFNEMIKSRFLADKCDPIPICDPELIQSLKEKIKKRNQAESENQIQHLAVNMQ